MITDLFTKQCSTREFLGKLGSITIRAAGSLWVAENFIEEPKVEAATPQQVLLLSKPPAAPAASGTSYILAENFENVTNGYENAGWTNSNGTPDYKATGIIGTQSLRCDASAASISCYFPISNQAELYGYIAINAAALPAANRIVFQLYATTTSLAQIISTTNALRVIATGGTGATSVGTISGDTLYYIWWYYKAGSANDTQFKIWFSTNETKPADGTNNTASSINGTNYTAINRISPYTQFTSGSGIDVRYDKIRLSTSAIGNSPA